MKYIVYICMYTYFGVCKYKHVHIFTYMHMYVSNMYLNACVCCMLSINIMAIFTCMSECYTYAFACVYIHILCIDIYWHMYIYNYIYTCTCAGLQRHPLVCFLTATWIEKWNLIFLNTCFNLCGSEDNMRVSGVIWTMLRAKLDLKTFETSRCFYGWGTRMLPSSQFEAKQFWNMRWSSSPKNRGNAAVHL